MRKEQKGWEPIGAEAAKTRQSAEIANRRVRLLSGLGLRNIRNRRLHREVETRQYRAKPRANECVACLVQ